ncbi:hypothetical protein WPS_26830 [Vulcanimicrobium alpinum]|uniref:PAC domain-containing protein n=2 Tax=Vulcanimicrobium alpinum TaxID=3016050 RepID=A0AAN2CB71_UNVUL|nr:hypothetical protein WPS_26830 [Vulcanimicrobium alpinum]
MLESRAIENIASAPATADDRRWAAVCSALVAAVFLASIPWGGARLPLLVAFLPTVVGAGIVVLTLTAILLYVQYRIERDPRLALLAIAYGYAAVTQLIYLLTFPQTFPQTLLSGLSLDSGTQTAAWAYVASQFGFGALLIAQALAARARWRISRDVVRLITMSVFGAVAMYALFVTLDHALLPELTRGGVDTPLLAQVIAPLLIVEMIVALVLVALDPQTVTQVWLVVVVLARLFAVLSAGEIANARFSTGWYVGRVLELVSAVIVLAVFLMKINDLMVRLAQRNRSTAEALAVGEARYASLANVVPQLLVTTDAAGSLEYVNDRWVAYTGLDLNASRDGEWHRPIEPADDAALRERWHDALADLQPITQDVRMREARTGRSRWFLCNAVPVRGADAAVAAWIATFTDIDAQKRLEEREAFIANAGDRLVASLDVDATVGAIASLLVPRLAERVSVALVDDDGHFRVAGEPVDRALQDAIAAVVAREAPFVAGPAERAADARWRRLGAGWSAVAPLISGESVIGALIASREERAYESDEVAMLREFARRAALSLDHARLYERERTTADALQRAMLPAQLPLLPDLRFSASYSAASESQRVGGDFYDAFTLPDGRVAITIGDVTGHGLEAAVIMGEIRQALRAAAFESAEPSAILDRASRLLVASGRSVFVTAIFGVLDPVTGRFAYASAGHPAPLLDDGTWLQRLPTAGLPIGLRDDQGVDFAIALHAPCTLVTFTDGLMEFARDLDEGERRIEAAIRALARDDIDHLAAAIMKDVLRDDEPTDDIAILTVTIDRFANERRGEEREWRFVSDDARTAAMVRRDVGVLTSAWTGRDDVRFPSELAFGELVANALRHAPGPVRVVLEADVAGVVTLTVEDRGPGFVARGNVVDPFAENGRGLTLVGGLADGFEIGPAPHGGTRARARFDPAERPLAQAR